ncbi:unnamed protein product [Didymodactylos carnosus]|uniref:Tyrosine-protein kinase n=1 Tax=Didymodactylos carnosus TaxID=1234261 RepID=A0A813TR64_9BILA|nr:unnamed protein product [Didymodactylos carnosus]CAF0814954.1 unnamed protein product [Didymodactylos carnosus]CAF3505085.1 unnamed protein product [Didymodactylos carnosus]CAF3600969.1 unnamed protein product [Didymodactylos carnosus]
MGNRSSKKRNQEKYQYAYGVQNQHSFQRRPYQNQQQQQQHQHQQVTNNGGGFIDPLASIHFNPHISHSQSTHINKNNNTSNHSKSSKTKQIYIANYDFNGTVPNGELSFRKQDQLEIVDRHTYNEWWFAKNLRSGHSGQESLSVLDLSSDKHFHVKHYRIRRTDSGAYYISSKTLFQTLQELVHHYQSKPDGLCCTLGRPCSKIKPTLPEIDRHGLLELDRKQLEKIALLGKGNYGEVYRGKYGNRDVAIKCMKTDMKNRSSNVEKFLDEARIMKNLNDKNIVRLYGVCTKEEPIFIVTEYMTNGCLLNYLREHGKSIQLDKLVDFAVQIARGMCYLEQRKYVHCDLAARNILVGEQNIAKIADFGLAKVVQDGRLLVDRESQFPIKWTAPEAATKKEYTTKSDVWSYGILLFELVTRGSNPYPGMSNNEALQAVLTGYRMPQPNDCPDTYYDAMLWCWKENPDNRPTFEYLYTYFDDNLIQGEANYRET